MTKKAIIYARTASQGDDEIEIKRQVQACSALAKKSRLTIIDTVLHEGINGMNGSEKRLLNLIGLCKKKKAKALIAYNIERLSRNCADYIRFLFLLKARGYRFLNSYFRRKLDPGDMGEVLQGSAWPRHQKRNH